MRKVNLTLEKKEIIEKIFGGCDFENHRFNFGGTCEGGDSSGYKIHISAEKENKPKIEWFQSGYNVDFADNETAIDLNITELLDSEFSPGADLIDYSFEYKKILEEAEETQEYKEFLEENDYEDNKNSFCRFIRDVEDLKSYEIVSSYREENMRDWIDTNLLNEICRKKDKYGYEPVFFQSNKIIINWI